MKELAEIMGGEPKTLNVYTAALLQNTPNIAVMLDMDLRTTFATAAYYRWAEFSEPEIDEGIYVRDAFRKMLRTADKDYLEATCIRVRDEGQRVRYMLKMYAHGKEEVFDIYIRPALDGQHNTVGVAIIMMNVTDIMVAKEKAEYDDKSKLSFLANVSHEIRTPMNAIKGLSEFIIRDSTDSFARENALMIKHASTTLLTIVNDILDFSKIVVGKMELVNQPFFLSSLLVDVYTMINIRLRDKKVEMELEIDKNIPCELIGDEIRIKQVMLNLLGNAVKFTDKGTIILRLRAEKLDDKRIRLCGAVEDTGIGIRQADLPKVFMSYAQVDTKKNRRAEGTGLGLPISRMLCESMDGDITVESVYGVGSTFSWTMKLEVANWQPVGKFAPTVELDQEKLFQYNFTIPEARILIVDDNEANLKVAEGLLRPYGAMLKKAKGALAALEILEDESFDIVMMDHMMPVMDGVEALHRLRQMPRHEKTTVVALTANVITDVEAEYKKMGFQGFLAKPLEAKELDACLRKLIAPHKIVKTDRPFTSKVYNDDGDILRQIYDEGRKKLRLLEDLAESRDWKNYTIEAHALKSVAALIGQKELSEMAKSHEMAGKKGDSEYIVTHLDKLLSKYSSLLALINDRLESEKKAKEDEAERHDASAEEIDSLIKQMSEAVEDYDLGGFSDLLERISQCKVGEKQRDLLDKMQAAKDEFDYDALGELISQWE